MPHQAEGAAERSEASQLSDRSDCGISAVMRREPPSGARPASSASAAGEMAHQAEGAQRLKRLRYLIGSKARAAERSEASQLSSARLAGFSCMLTNGKLRRV
jgi:hypothetical protein